MVGWAAKTGPERNKPETSSQLAYNHELIILFLTLLSFVRNKKATRAFVGDSCLLQPSWL